MCIHSEPITPPGFLVDSCEHGEPMISIAHVRGLLTGLLADTCGDTDCPGCEAKRHVAVSLEAAFGIAALEHDLHSDTATEG